MKLDELFYILALILYFLIFLGIVESSSIKTPKDLADKEVAPGLPLLNDEEVYSWNTLRDYVEYYENSIETIRKNYPALEDHLIKSQWFSIIDVLQCEYEIDQDKRLLPAKMKIKDLPEIINDVKFLWKEKNFLHVSLEKSEFIQRCTSAIRNLILHKSITVESYDKSLLKSICNESSTMFFNPAMLYEELKTKTDYEKQRIPISRLTCIDKHRIRIGQWSAIVHLHALDLEDGRDRIFNNESSSEEDFLPYSPPDSFLTEIEVENFELICKEVLSDYYSRIEDKNVILEIFCKDAKDIYYNNPLDVHAKYAIYGTSIKKLVLSEIKKKAGKVNPPSLMALNLMEYRSLRISEWGVIVEQLNIDKNSKPRYDRVVGNISIDPRPYGFITSLNSREFEEACISALINRVKRQEEFMKSILNIETNSEKMELDEEIEWERQHSIEVIEPDTFCKDAAGNYFGINRDSFAVLRELPLINPPTFIDPGRGLLKSDLPPKILDLNNERSAQGSERINDINWRVEASSFLWEKLIKSRVHSRIENAITNIQWQMIKQQANGFVFLDIGIEGFYNGIEDPPKSIFSFSDDPFGMYSQCLHAFSESNRRKTHVNYFDRLPKLDYKWTISKQISEELIDKGINSENFESFKEYSTLVKQSLCMEAVKEYFENANDCPVITDEIELIKYNVKNTFPNNPFPDAKDPMLADPDGELEAKEQWEFIYEYSLKSRNRKLSNSDYNENIIIVSQKMPFSYLEFRQLEWRTKHECYQDMAVNCIQSSWRMVESNWKNQDVQTDLASALAIFCDSVAILYFERKKQWRQLIKLMETQKYSPSFFWVRRGFYLPKSYDLLKVSVNNGKERRINKEELEIYKKSLVNSILELVSYRYLAPLTVDIEKLCNSLAIDMSVATTRGIWIGLVPVDSEVLIEMERLSNNNIHLEKKDEAVGYYPIRNQFSPRKRVVRGVSDSKSHRLKRDKNEQTIKMTKLKSPIKTTVMPNIRLLQYKKIVEKDEDDLPLEYPIKSNNRADWRKYINRGVDEAKQNLNQKTIQDFYKVDWARPFGSSDKYKYGYITYDSRVPIVNQRIPFNGKIQDLGYGDPQISRRENKVKFLTKVSDVYRRSPDLYRGVQKDDQSVLIKSPSLLVGQKIANIPLKLEEFVNVPDIPRTKPLSKEEILERAKHIQLDDSEFEESIDTNKIIDYLNNASNNDFSDIEALNYKTETSKSEDYSVKDYSLPSTEIIHSVIKSSEYYKIMAECIPHFGYTIGKTLSEKDLMKGARFVYRCLRMDGHFVTPQTAYRIWIRSQFLRRNTPKVPLTPYKEEMKDYIKKRKKNDNQIYCPGKLQDKIDEMADTIATAAYINGVFPADKMIQICNIARDFVYKRIGTITQCVKAFKRHISRLNGEYTINHRLFPTICTHIEQESGKNLFSSN
ncbi:uncharacterized protein cubi_03053 [Cryptosporidium ubiquitum]|uniref:Uncharacterized protein n=1 Tax=Cryptosporidium ubiquitum TaxID=857276 RepID=A0A1J4MKX6_9CRYT|nr:uncharacterized protein cubi_03053 [Cryptosporidium ubiquitum]OII74922.1 hypothetical protein cubi_03053 [Cryptosporidium ubiquitum]